MITREEAIAIARTRHPEVEEVGPDNLPPEQPYGWTPETLQGVYLFEVQRKGTWIGGTPYIAVSRKNGAVEEFTVGE